MATAKKLTPKKPTARSTAKVSALKGMSLEAWMESKLSGWQAQVAKELVELVQKKAPKATASIKWGQPVFEQDGPFAFIRPAKSHLTFGFWRGMELSDPKGVLEGSGDRMKHLKIASPEALDKKLVSALVAEAVKLNKEKGDPTKRK